MAVKKIIFSRGNKKPGLSTELAIMKFYENNFICIFNGLPCMTCHPGACSFRVKKEN